MPDAAFFKRIRDQFTWPIAAFWLISLTPFFIENGPQLTHAFSSKCHVETERYGSLYESVRRWVRKRDPFSQSPDNVVLVTYSSYEGRYIMANFCAARAFTAMVLERIVKASPAAIAVDWTNNPGTCPPNDRGTLLLKESVRRVLNGQVADPKGRKYPAVPIVTARRTWIKSELDAENRTHATGIDPAALRDDEQVGRPDVLDDSG